MTNIILTIMGLMLCYSIFGMGYIAGRQVARKAYNAEADEFNAGFEAYHRGEPIDNDPCGKYDSWSTGWVWAKWCKETYIYDISEVQP